MASIGFGLLATICTAVLPFPQPGTAPPVMRAVTTVQPTLGFATDSGGNVLPSTASERTLLTADIIRRINTARGTLPDTKIPTKLGRYGIDLLDYIAADMTPGDIGRLCSNIDEQIRQDERVARSRTTAVLSGFILLVTIALVDSQGPFKLVLTINALTSNTQVLS
jgi:hypothetical protein